jgi:hypothetical protein
MKLRDHPLMTYKDFRSWPPAWLWRGGYETTHPEGEVGILKEVISSNVASYSSCFLIMEHCGAEYLGVLVLSDPSFCRQIYALLVENCGETISEIGDIDLSYML